MLKYLLLLLPLFLTNCASGIQNEKIEYIDQLISQEMEKSNIPGMAISVGKNGKQLFSKGYGFANISSNKPVTTDTTFHIASITKTITATAIVQLVEQKKIALDTPINRYLDFSVNNPHFPQENITVRQLLNHTSSISDEKAYEIDFRVRGKDSEIELEQLVKGYLQSNGEFYEYNKNYLQVKPGTTWSYSNIGYALLGYILEKVTDEDLRSFSEKHIFSPLQMDRSYWRIAETPIYNTATSYHLNEDKLTEVQTVGFADWPAGMIRSTASDVNSFALVTANSNPKKKNKLLKHQSILSMLAMATFDGLPPWNPGQGLGWGQSMLDGKPIISHWGGDPGVFTAVYIDPKTTAAVTILMNTSANKDTMSSLKTVAIALFDLMNTNKPM